MQKLANRDKEILNEVIANAKHIIETKTSSKSDKEQATIFLEYSEKYKNRNRVIKSEMTYIKQYIAVYRMTKELQKKQEKEKEKAKSDIGKKRKILNASKFSIGGLFTKDLSKLAYDEKICYEAMLFALAKISGYSEFLAKGWSIEYKGWEDNNGIYIIIGIPKQHKKENGEIINYKDYVFICFFEKNGKLDKSEMHYRSFDYQRLDDKGQAKRTNHTKHSIPQQTANHFLSALGKMGLVEYDPLSSMLIKYNS